MIESVFEIINGYFEPLWLAAVIYAGFASFRNFFYSFSSLITHFIWLRSLAQLVQG